MGGAISIPGMPDVPVQDVSRIAQEVITVYTPMYLATYPGKLVDQAVSGSKDKAAEKEESGKPQLQLVDAPIPSDPIKFGCFEKRGDVRKTWKSRHFVAMNQADNFVVYYFTAAQKEDEAIDATKAKGAMRLDGYTVERVTSGEEQEELGCGTIALKMACGRRRLWVVKFATEDELQSWERIFRNAATKAKPPMNPDGAMRETFVASYHRLRWHYRQWSWWTPAGTEEEMLGMLIVDEVNTQVMGDVYRQLGNMSPTVSRIARQKIMEILDSTIGAVVATGWKGITASAGQAKSPVEAKITEQLSVIIDAQTEFKGKIRDATLSTIQPMLEKLAKPVLEPALKMLVEPIYKAFARNMEMYVLNMRELGTKDTHGVEYDLYHYEFYKLLREADYWWGYMRPVYRKFWDFSESDAMKALSEIGNFSRWRVEYRIEEGLKSLHKKALFTAHEQELKPKGKHPSKEQFSEAAKAILSKMANDSKILAHQAVVRVLLDALEPVFKEQVIPAVQGLVSPISSLVPDFLKSSNLLDIDNLLDELLMEILTDFCNAAAKPLGESRNGMFDEISYEGTYLA